MRLAIEAGEATHKLAAELGIRGVPVGAEEVVDKGGAIVRDQLEEKGLVPCQIGAFGLNPIRPQASAVSLVEQAIEQTGPCGCTVVVVPGGSYHQSVFGGWDRRNFTDEAMDTATSTLAPLVARAADHGAILSIEPYIKSVVHSVASFLTLKERIGSHSEIGPDRADALRINVDVTSFYDLRALIDPAPLLHELVPQFAGHAGVVHVKEIGLEEGFHIHAGLKPITDGPTDWELVLKLLKAVVPENCWLLLEHVQNEEEGRSSVAHLRTIAENAGVTLG